MHDDHDGPGPGHNAPPRRPLQWQTPHRADDHDAPAAEQAEADLDLVEAAFVQGFEQAPDPTSFLRLARVPFVTERGGRKLELLRVETHCRTDVAALAPQLGGAGHRVAPLPAALVGRRKSLRFIYLGSAGQESLSLAEIRPLPDLTPER
jgi:hypothetical protein